MDQIYWKELKKIRSKKLKSFLSSYLEGFENVESSLFGYASALVKKEKDLWIATQLYNNSKRAYREIGSPLTLIEMKSAELKMKLTAFDYYGLSCIHDGIEKAFGALTRYKKRSEELNPACKELSETGSFYDREKKAEEILLDLL